MTNTTSINNPTCYHSACRYFAELTDTALTKVIRIESHDHLYSKKPRGAGDRWKPKLLYKSYDITVVDIAGVMVPFHIDHKRYDARGIVADHFLVQVNKTIDEFNVPYEKCGTYRDSYTQADGGGYSICSMYKAGDFYFVPAMDCSCN